MICASCAASFVIPKRRDGADTIYFAGNSLGLMPRRPATTSSASSLTGRRSRSTRTSTARRPGFTITRCFARPEPRLVGARPGEVVMMNSLTVNLHLMLVSFFQPSGKRTKILLEEGAFPSDTYAMKSHLGSRGLDWREHLILARPRANEHTLRIEDLETLIARHGDELALALLPAVQFFTGQVFDIARLTAAVQRVGAIAGWDLAHGAGNIAVGLHEANVDFACWCSYKYLNSGPGAIAGTFVHERHAKSERPRYAGWWGNDPATRFQMQLIPDFVPRDGADGWQISNPPIFAMAPLRASLELFDSVGMPRLRAKSRVLTGYLAWLLRERASADSWEIITPSDCRGARMSALDRGQRSPSRALRGAARRGRRLRLSRPERDPRGADAVVQHVP
jgi:kynureninase